MVVEFPAADTDDGIPRMVSGSNRGDPSFKLPVLPVLKTELVRTGDAGRPLPWLPARTGEVLL